MSSRKRELEVPPPSQLDHDDDVDSSSSSGDALAPPTPPQGEDPVVDAPIVGSVPDLEAFFALHPHYTAAQIIKLCRTYAAFKQANLPSNPREKKKWPWSRREEDESSPAHTTVFKHPRREYAEPSEKRKKRYWEK